MALRRDKGRRSILAETDIVIHILAITENRARYVMKPYPLISLAAALLLISSPVLAQTSGILPTRVAADQNVKAETADIATLQIQAQAGDVKAQVRLADDYFTGNGIGQDYAKAFDWYRKAANAGDPEAQTELGLMYAKGYDVTPVDYKEAIHWTRIAAEQGYVGAQYNLGVAYDNGLGVEADLPTAFSWYLKAAEQGYDIAQFNVATMFEAGQGVLQDLASARDWYQKAADQGNAPARYNLGNMYLTGRGVEKDAARGLALVEASARQGFPLAQSRMAGLYYAGEAVPQDKVKAYAWALLAAGDGDPEGQNLMKAMDGNHLLNEADMRQASALADTYASAQ